MPGVGPLTGRRRVLGAVVAGALAVGLPSGAILAAGSTAGAAVRAHVRSPFGPGTSPTGSLPGNLRHGTHPTASLPSGHHVGAVPAAPVATGAPSIYVTNNGTSSVAAYSAAAKGNASPTEMSAGVPNPSVTAFDTSGDLWVSETTTDTLAEYTPAQLAAGGSPAPHTVSSSALDAPTGIAFDGAGDLWVANYANSTVVEFTAAQLAAGGNQTPVVTLTSDKSTSLDGPAGLAFAGTSLLVTNSTTSTVVELTASQLAVGATPSPTPALTLTATATSLDNPYLMTFDKTGNLWLGNDANSTVVEIAKATLAGTGTKKVTPAVKLTATGTSLNEPAGLAFDNSSLWVANGRTSTLVEFTSTALTKGGTQKGHTDLYLGRTTTFAGPDGIAFHTSDLWVANYTAASVVELTPTALGTSGAPTPEETLSNGLNRPAGAALDSAGDLWVASFTGDSVVEYTASSLASGNPTPKVVLGNQTTAFDGPGDLAFSSTGNLWVTDLVAGTVVEITRATLLTSGSPTPKLTLEMTSTHLGYPIGLAFDASGNLWVANDHSTAPGGRGSVAEIPKSTLAGTGTQTATPAVTVTSPALTQAGGLAFDAAGDLWVTSAATTGPSRSSLLELTPSALSTSGTKAPKVVLTSDAATSLDYPFYPAFDAAGDLWVANYTSDAVVEFTPAELASSGSPVPADVIQGTATGLYEPLGLAITPVASTTAVHVTPPSVPQGTAVTYSATVTATVNGTPTGTVAFSIGSTSLCTATLSGGSGSCTATDAPAGADTVTGAFSGDTTHASSQGTAALAVTANPVTKAATSGPGYWEVASDGGVFSFTAPFHGSTGGQRLNTPVVGMAKDEATGGYWEVASDGGVFAFTAPFYGSMGGHHLNKPIVGIAALPTGKGYYEVASDGGIFAFGTAKFHGSMGGTPLNQPVVGMAFDAATGGYYEVAADGGLFAFTAPFKGSMGGTHLNQPVVGMAYDATTAGYWEVASDGGIFSFTAPFKGSMGGHPLNQPVVGMAAAG